MLFMARPMAFILDIICALALLQGLFNSSILNFIREGLINSSNFFLSFELVFYIVYFILFRLEVTSILTLSFAASLKEFITELMFPEL